LGAAPHPTPTTKSRMITASSAIATLGFN
jgi:hypothetical protein